MEQRTEEGDEGGWSGRGTVEITRSRCEVRITWPLLQWRVSKQRER